jgi:hypothetical protein
MKERRDPRFEANQAVWITLFGEPDIQLPARIKNVSGRGIGLELDGPVAAGAPLKLELDDTLILGEVIFCRQDKSSYYVGVEISQKLSGLAELGNIVRSFNEELAGEAIAVPVSRDRRRS